VCQAWSEGRDERLGAIIAEAGYIAAGPPSVRVLSGLHSGRLAGDELGADCVPSVLDALDDGVAEIRQRAEDVLRSLGRTPAVDALCATWVQVRDPRLGAIIAESGYVASQPVEAAILSMLKAGKLRPAVLAAHAVPVLVTALDDDDPVVRQNAAAGVRSLTPQPAIDALCAHWVEGRDERLGSLIAECGYVASRPAATRVLSALLAGKTGNLDLNADAFPLLLAALDDEDERVRRGAAAGLRSLQEQPAIDALCGAWADSREGRLAEIIAESGYVARQPLAIRVLTALLCGSIAPSELSRETVPVLVEAMGDEDERVRAGADAALRSLQGQVAINALCAAWAKGRDVTLGAIISDCRFIAAKPLKLRVLSGLQSDALTGATAQVEDVAVLITALGDRDPRIRQRAGLTLRTLECPEAIDALCEAVIAKPSGPGAAVVEEGGHRHSVVSRRCLVYLLTGQIERYIDLDYDLQYARAEYRAGDETLKAAIAEAVRRSGDQRLAGILLQPATSAGPISKRASELTEHEAGVVVEVYARHGRWHDVLELLFHMPLCAVPPALSTLRKAQWVPDDPTEAALLEELWPALGETASLPGSFPPPDQALGPVFAEWIAEGRSGPTSELSEEELRALFLEGPPPQAVSALAALVSCELLAPADVEAAQTHRHWLVRLASLALCELEPGLLLAVWPEDEAANAFWVAHWAPRVVAGRLARQRAIALGHEQVENLSAELAGGSDKAPALAALARILCALASHHLRHDIELDDEMYVAIDETDIEVEG